MPNPRGAPPGNTNALKHGFYSRLFRQAVRKTFDNTEFTGLQEEIDLLRLYTHRVLEMGKDTGNLEEAANLLRVLALASTSLARMVRTQHILARSGATTDEIFHQALLEALTELESASPSLSVADPESPHPPFESL